MSVWSLIGTTLGLISASAPGQWEVNRSARVAENTQPTQTAEAAEKTAPDTPSWTREARWYQIVVPRFRNGDPSNDPEGTLSWLNGWPAVCHSASTKVDELDARQYGGDLQGLQERLPYLKSLGVNTLYLTSVFGTPSERTLKTVDLRHVDDALGARGSRAEIKGETLDPTTWRFSASDRILITFVARARKEGFRVILRFALANARKDLATLDDAEGLMLAVTRRWMDPNGDGNPSDGIDGWIVTEPRKLPRESWKRWREHVKRLNPNAVLLLDVGGDTVSRVSGNVSDLFDLMVNYRVADAVRRFFSATPDDYTLARFMADLGATDEHRTVAALHSTPVPLSGPMTGRLLSALSRAGSTPNAKSAKGGLDPTADTPARWQLATVFHFFYLGAPMVYYGDEVGMYGGAGACGRAPMWWRDLPDAAPKSPAYRGDFASLIQWLNVMRQSHAPLQRGKLRTVLLDGQRRILAFSRSIPGHEVVLVMNYGNTKQKVTLQGGRPGQLVGVLSPRLGSTARRSRGRPARPEDRTRIWPLRIGVSRQFVDNGGFLQLWINPMAVSVVLIKDDEPL